MYDFDFTGLFVLALIGIVALVVLAIGGLVGLVWLFHHLQFV